MLIIQSDIWQFEHQGFIVIPTNFGWDKYDRAIMGAGLALQAAKKYPWLPVVYGAHLRWSASPEEHGGTDFVDTMTSEKSKLITLVTKPLNRRHPELSWRAKSDITTIEDNLFRFAKITVGMRDMFYLPLLGCGCGELKREQVLPIMQRMLRGKNYVLVERA